MSGCAHESEPCAGAQGCSPNVKNPPLPAVLERCDPGALDIWAEAAMSQEREYSRLERALGGLPRTQWEFLYNPLDPPTLPYVLRVLPRESARVPRASAVAGVLGC